jgi:hypothetical protein
MVFVQHVIVIQQAYKTSQSLLVNSGNLTQTLGLQLESVSRSRRAALACGLL